MKKPNERLDKIFLGTCVMIMLACLGYLIYYDYQLKENTRKQEVEEELKVEKNKNFQLEIDMNFPPQVFGIGELIFSNEDISYELRGISAGEIIIVAKDITGGTATYIYPTTMNEFFPLKETESSLRIKEVDYEKGKVYFNIKK